ncbi:MAG: type II toxin-antitoxin system HicA family toxin [Gemmatimonadaceae bacterium]
MGKQDATLIAIFTEPTPANIRWNAIESLLRSEGAAISQGAGSRVRVVLNGVRATFHRPHPRPEAHRPLVRSVRRLLENAGIRP